ncbi:RNA pseudouridylate synthase [Hamiltosporidium tvaerminnensis]|uniref:RNA pseudouridylate synthase n=1 Tax=Hamiltosporidium tvaerminnensis TaxID=1176355 RepID=A0A4Q9L9X8_9MICR|nr:hypothetical protein LUQ84_002064 [Hamiltosporidium tvaerminnensis]TBU04559.1 RNA pseudouridylate synthase [Hamiltosporidium tvaerminnensis]
MSVSYFHTYKSHIKGRWLNKPLQEALSSEFTHRPPSYYTNAIISQAITINDQPTNPDKILSSNDILYHTVHIHEPLPKQLKIIKIESEYLVLEKPFGVPCHPTTEYFHCSVSQSLKQFVYFEIFNNSEFLNKEFQSYNEKRNYRIEKNKNKTNDSESSTDNTNQNLYMKENYLIETNENNIKNSFSSTDNTNQNFNDKENYSINTKDIKTNDSFASTDNTNQNFNDKENYSINTKDINTNNSESLMNETDHIFLEKKDIKINNSESSINNTNQKFLEKDFPLLLNFNFATFNPKITLSCINRLDLPVSGILIIAFLNSQKYHKIIKNSSTKKFYVALVKGNFPNKISVNKKLKFVKGKKSFVDEQGKESFTDFYCLKRNKEYSLIECMPLTGRPHQIRAHLSSIGFPIINDIKYGYHQIPNESNEISFGCFTPLDHTQTHSKYRFAINNCKGIKSKSFRNYNEYICLHAYKYVFNGNTYECELPEWANI